MSDFHPMRLVEVWLRPVWFSVASVLLGPGLLLGGSSEKSLPKNLASVGKNQSAAGFLLRRPASGKTWQALPSRETLQAGDQVLALPGTQAVLDTTSRTVRLVLRGQFSGKATDPLLESAVTLGAAGTDDLDMHLERGAVVLQNRRQQGPSRVRVHFQKQVYLVTLSDPGTKVSLEGFSRWPAGAPFTLKPGPEDVPTASLSVFVLQGQADLKTGMEQFSMHAPPGPAYFNWNSVTGQMQSPRHRDHLPPWANPKIPPPPKDKPIQAAAESLTRDLSHRPVAEVLAEAVQSQNPQVRQLAVLGLGATDELEQLVSALVSPKQPDVRDRAVDALRQWIGRGAGQDQRLYDLLVKKCSLRRAQGEIVLTLLHGFSREERRRVETYDTLIAYLTNGQLLIRELARRCLDEGTTAGQNIPFDAAAPEEERARAVAAWKKLLSEGRLPPRTDTKEPPAKEAGPRP